MTNKTKLLLTTCIFGAITFTMLIGNIFFKASFGYLPFIFLLSQAVFLILMIKTDD